MTESPVIITRSRRGQADAVKEFGFKPARDVMNPLSGYRQKAWNSYSNLPFPTTKNEAYRWTDLSKLPTDEFQVNCTAPGGSIPADLLQPVADADHGGQIILSTGNERITLSDDLKKKGVIFTDFKHALQTSPELLEKLSGSVINPGEEKFGALTAAMADNGILLYVPRGVQVDTPLHSLFWAAGTGTANFNRILVFLEEGASVTYVHESSSPAMQSGAGMLGGLIEIQVGPGAKLRFVELQSLGENIWNFSHEKVRVERDGEVDWVFGALGSHLTKNFSEIDLVGQGSTGKMSGFYFSQHDQHLDHDTQQNHLAAHTTSDLLFKGALLDHSRSVWQGMIYVSPEAVKTDGYQANRNLILSEGARADSIPGLEILTDDVRCSHGATVGKIDPDEVFYLQTRGLPKAEAEKLIVEGFFDPIMQRIPFEGVKRRFKQAIEDKMQRMTK